MNVSRIDPRYRSAHHRGGRARLGALAATFFLLALGTLVLLAVVTTSDRPAAPDPVAPPTPPSVGIPAPNGSSAEPLEAPHDAGDVEERAATTPPAATPEIRPEALPTLADLVVRARRPDGELARAWTLEIDDVALVTRSHTAPRTRVDVDDVEYRVRLRANTVHKLAAFARGYASESRSVTPVPGTDPLVVELALNPAGEVHVLVHDDSGRAVPGLPLCLRADLDPAHPASLPLDLMATADAHGAATFPSVPPGAWTLIAGDRASPLARRTGIAVTTAALTLDPLRLPALYPLALRVEDADGRPVARAELTARGTNGGSFEIETDVDGLARVEGLPAGRFRVFAATGTARANRVVNVPNDPRDAVVTIRLRGGP